MTCFMKKMRYMEKNMRNGPAWIGNEVNILKRNLNATQLLWVEKCCFEQSTKY